MNMRMEDNNAKMEEETLLGYPARVRQRLSSCLFGPNSNPGYVRGTLMEVIFPIYMIQTAAYKQLKASIDVGEMPWYVADLMIVCLGSVEAMAGSFVGWLGYQRRRTAMLSWLVLLTISFLLMLAVPPAFDPKVETALCHDGSSELMPNVLESNAAIRISILTLVGVITSLTLISIWSHCIAFIDERNPDETINHFGILVAARVLAYFFISQSIDSSLRVWVLVLANCLFMVLNFLKTQKIPEQAPLDNGVEISSETRGYLASVGRVFSSKLAMMQMFGAGLLASALWGFAWHKENMFATLYNVVSNNNWMTMYADILRYHFVILMILYVSKLFSKPLTPQFDKIATLKTSMIYAMITFPLYIVMVTVFTCNKGEVAGLVGREYTQPNCSTTCGCSAPFNEFTPVCLTDSMVTYASPCHAGCSISQEIGGVTSMTNCACGALTARATLGACDYMDCVIPYEINKLVFLAAIIFSACAFQLQGVTILRSVDPRDRSTALGMTCGIVALMVFCVGHSTFFAIQKFTCAWSDNDRCLLYNNLYPYLIAGTSSILALVAGILGIVSFVVMKNITPKEAAAASMTRNNSANL